MKCTIPRWWERITPFFYNILPSVSWFLTTGYYSPLYHSRASGDIGISCCSPTGGISLRLKSPSRNHRLVKTGRDFWRWSRPTPYWSRDTWRLAQDRVQALSPWSGLPHGICSPRYCLLPSNCSSRALHRVRPGDQHPVHHENLGFCPGFSLPVIAQQLWNALLTDVYI